MKHAPPGAKKKVQTTDWHEFFKNAHKSSWPTCSCMVGKHNIWDDQKKDILEAAAKYGYKIYFESASYVGFINPSREGEAFKTGE